jgi:uncharacterized protein YkuJ
MKTFTKFLGIIAVGAVIMIGIAGCNTLQSIEVKPTRTLYGQGQELDMVVMGHYKKDSQDITGQAAISGYDRGKPGEQTVTVSFKEKTETFTVTVVPIAQIVIQQPPATQVFMQGDDFNSAGLVMQVEFENGAVPSQRINSPQVSGYNKDKAGVQTLTVNYYGKQASFDIRVAGLTGIVVASPPSKTEYLAGEDLDLAGIVIKGTWEGMGEKPVNVTKAQVSGYNKDKAGVQTLTVDYSGKRASFDIRVAGLTGIVVASPPNKTEYFVGEDLDLTGVLVNGIWEGMGEKPVNVTKENFSSIDKTRAGKQNVVVSYQGKTTSFSVTFVAMQSIIIFRPPAKLNYENGEQLDIEGLAVQGTRGGASSIEMVDISRLQISGYDRFKAGNQTITITLGGKTDTFRVTVGPNPFVGTWRGMDVNTVTQRNTLITLTITEDLWTAAWDDQEYSGTYTRDSDSGKRAALALKGSNFRSQLPPTNAEILSTAEMKLVGGYFSQHWPLFKK